MRKTRFSVTGYFRELFRDRVRRKAFFVGLIVFVLVFIGLTAYQRSMEKKQGDVIITDSGTGAAQESPGAGGIAAEGDGFGNNGENPGSAATGGDGYGYNGENPGAATGPDGIGGDGYGKDGENPGGDAIGQGTATPAAIFVDVGGAVRMSGLFALPHGSRVADAIEAAGGLTEDADVKYLNRAAVLSDSDRLYIPTAAEIRDGTAPPSAGQLSPSGAYSGGAAGGAAAGSPASGGPGTAGNGTGTGPGTEPGLVNINTADSEELQRLNGVGPVTAQKIIDYRAKNGGFGRVEEIMNVSGIGAKTFENLRAYITV